MEPVPFDSDRWRFEAGEHVVEDYSAGGLVGRSWTRHEAEPTGLLDLARANAVGEGWDGVTIEP